VTHDLDQVRPGRTPAVIWTNPALEPSPGNMTVPGRRRSRSPTGPVRSQARELAADPSSTWRRQVTDPLSGGISRLRHHAPPRTTPGPPATPTSARSAARTTGWRACGAGTCTSTRTAPSSGSPRPGTAISWSHRHW